MQVRDQVQLHKTHSSWQMFSYFIDVRTNIRDKNPLDIKFSPVYEKSGLEASGTIRLHG